MKLLRDQRGQTAIIMGLCLASLCGMAGLAVDVGTLFRAKRVLQTAADAAAIAGAGEMNYGDVTAGADAATALNGLTNGSNGVTVTVNRPPLSGPHAGSTAFVEVIVTQNAPTYFMKMFHLGSMSVAARAVSGVGPSNGCIYALDPSGIDVGLTGNGSLSMPDCGILVNSASSNAVDLTGVSSLTAQSIGIVGGYVNGSNTTLNPVPITGIAPATDPLAFETPPSFDASTCLSDPHPNSATTLGPSNGGTICYNGLTVGGHGVVTLNPGVYVINGGFSSAGGATITGNDVTIYLAAPNGSVSLTGSGALNVTAPTPSTCLGDTCGYDGILFYEDPADTNGMKVAGSSNSTIEGIFYLPSASLTLTGNSGSQIYADLVVHALSISGTGTLQNYAGINGAEPITSARLVE